MATTTPKARQPRRPKAPVTRPGQNGFNHRHRYGLVIECPTEADQKRLYAKLQKSGYAPKVVCV